MNAISNNGRQSTATKPIASRYYSLYNKENDSSIQYIQDDENDQSNSFVDRARPMASQGGSRSCRSEEPLNQLPSNNKRFGNFEEERQDSKGDPGSHWHRVDDMIRGTITVSSVSELWEAFIWFKNCNFIDVLQIRDKLSSDSRHVEAIFNFDNRMLGEM